MVTICTTSLTFSNSTFCPHSVFMCFVWIWEQTAIISLHNLNWLVFITETECVYCAVRAGPLYIIDVNSSVQAVPSLKLSFSCLSVPKPGFSCCEQTDRGTVFILRHSNSPLPVSFHSYSTFMSLLTEGQAGQTCAPSKTLLLRKLGNIG